jgi:hypothetical protein
MQRLIEDIRVIRKMIAESISGLSTEQLNEVPEGFNNNIIWNVGHLIAAQQNICYLKAGLTPFLDDSFFHRYKPESKPEVPVPADEIKEINDMLLTATDRLKQDYNAHVFTDYQVWTNRYGLEMSNIETALRYLFFHEGLHFGYIMALKRIITKK